ncbi:MAG TPA: hypothetical protein VIH01_07230 [Blastococcus sp.]
MSTALVPAEAGPGAVAAPPHGIWRWVAAVSAAVAGGLHVAAAVEHLGTPLAVAFFLVVALLQLGLGAWVAVSTWAEVGPDVRLLTLALAGTVALVGLYLVAHTTDLLAAFHVDHASGAGHHGTTGAPQGHSTETSGPVALGTEPVAARESVGLLGIAAVTLEMASVLAFVALLPGRWRNHAANALLVLGGVAWVLWLIGALV